MDDKNRANTALNQATPAGRTTYGSSALSSDPTDISSGPVSSIPRRPNTPVEPIGFGRFVKRLAAAVIVLLILGVGAIVAISRFTGNEGGSPNVAGEFSDTEIPLADLPTGESFSLGASSLTVNGPLRVNDTFVLTPQAQPVQAVAGQLYFDQTTNALTYYNGTDYVALQGNNIVSVASGSPNVTVTNDGSGNIIISSTGGGGGTLSSTGGTTGRIAKFTGAQSLSDSLLSESGTTLTVNGSLSVTSGLSLGSPLTVANGGTGATTLAVNGVVVSNGTAALNSITAGAAGQCLVSTAGAPTFAACPGGAGSAFIQDGNSFGATATLGTNDGFGLAFEVNTTTVMTISTVGAVNFRNQSNSVSAFTIQNAAASATIVNVDTTNQRVGIGGTAGLSKLEVLGGDAAIYNSGGNPRLIIGDSTAGGENGFIMWDSANNYLRVETAGTNGLKLNDNFITIGNVFPDQPLKIANGTTLLTQINTTGQALFQNSSNSTTAFRVLNAAGTTSVLTVDTSSPLVRIQGGGTDGGGNRLLFGTDDEISIGENGAGDSDVLALDARVGHKFTVDGTESVDFSQNGLATFTATNDAFGGLNVNQVSGNHVLRVSTAGSEGAVNIGYASDIAATVFYLDADATSDPTGAEGGMYYNNSTNKFRCYENTGWVDCLPAGGGSVAFIQGGNSFGGAATLGTNDGFDLNIERGGTTQLTVGNGGVTLASGVDLLLQGTSAYISNSQGQTRSKAFGLTATVNSNDATAVGAETSANNRATALGSQAEAAGNNSVAIGNMATTAANDSIAIGSSTLTELGSVAIGQSAVANHHYSVALGAGATTGTQAHSIAIGAGATATATNQLVIGSDSTGGEDTSISQVYIGDGVTSTTPNSVTIQGTGGSGSNIAGASVTLAAGRSTGNANGGNLNFQVSAPGGSGSSLNSLTTVATFSGASGALTLQNATNSTDAFRVLNAAGQQLLKVGSVHNTADLVTNGSLETNDTGWVAKGSATRARITTQQYIGLASLQVDTSATAGDGVKYNVTLSSSTEYTVQFWAKLSSGSFSNMAFGYASDGVTETDCKTGQSLKTGGWQVFNCTFTTGTVSGTPYFYWEQATGVARTVYVDALQIVPGPDIGVFYEGKIDVSGLNFSGPVAIQNDNDSQAAFQIQSSSGTTVFGADSLNKRVGINLIQPTATLHVTTIGTTSVTALFNQSGSSSEDILQLSKSNDLTVTVAHTGATTFQNLTNSTTAFRILAFNATFGSGTPLFVVDTTNSRAYIGNPTSDTTGALLVLDTKSDSGDPTAVLGAMYYNANRGKMRCVELDQGSTGYWRDCIDTARTSFEYVNDMLTRNTDSVTEIFGSTSQQSGDTRHPGIVRFTTGGAGTDAGAEGFGVSGDAEINFLLGNGDIWRFEIVNRIDDLSTSAQRFTWRAGFNDDMANAEDGADGCYFRYSDDINGGDWQGVCRSNSTESVCDTNIAVAADTWYRLTVVVASSSSVDFQTDGTSRCTISTNVPTGAGRQTTFMNAVKKEVGATARNVDIDYFSIRSEFGTSR